MEKILINAFADEASSIIDNQIIAMILTYPISYWTQRKFVFKKKSKVK